MKRHALMFAAFVCAAWAAGCRAPAPAPSAKPAAAASQVPAAPTPPAAPQPPIRLEVRAAQPPAPALRIPPPSENECEMVWDSFEGFNHWAVEAADDPARLSINKDAAKVSAGRRSLRVDFQAFRKNRTHLRRETSLDLSRVTKMRLDVYAEQDGLKLSVAFRLTAAQRYAESYPVELKKGWNKDVTIDLLGEFNTAERGAPKPEPLDGREDVRRVSLVIHEKPETKGVVFIDNIRFYGWPQGNWLRREPKLERVTPSADALPQYQTLTLAVEFDGQYGNYFDPGEVDLRAVFVSPEGERFTAYGFLNAWDDDAEEGRWLIKFTPTVVGRWEYNVLVRTRGGEQLSPTYALDCTEPDGGRGFIRRSPRDGRYFEFDNGDFFYPIGQNVCWATDYEPYFRKMAANGENFARIWMCPWHLPLEPKNALASSGLELKGSPGRYSLRAAQRMDRLVALAETYGVYLQIVIEYHGMVDGSWSENPYNIDNNGPCRRAEEFFVDSEARRLFKQRLRYIAARWGWSTHIMAWELFNEVDLGKYYDRSDVIRWHNEMANYLRRVDPHRHLITTSCYTNRLSPDIWRLGRIDYVQTHHYGPDILAFALRDADAQEDLNKPFFIGEFGRGWTADADQKDLRGAHLHAGLWASFMSLSAGAAMPWWWDTYIAPRNLYYHFKALAAFAKGEDRRRMNYKPVRLQADAPDLRKVDVRGLICSTRALLWVFDRRDASALADEIGAPRIPAGTKLRLSGMWPGDYVIEMWDTFKGEVVNRTAAHTDDGALVVTFPEAQVDAACKVMYQGSTEPSVTSVPAAAP